MMLYREKKDIIAWLDKYMIKDYTLRQDETYGYVVDVAGDVFLWRQNLIEIPVKFGTVSGHFFCSDNELTSLEGSPHTVGGYFDCDGNQLTSLEGAQQTVAKDFYCADNQLTSLKAIPQRVEGFFYCRGNPALGELQDITDLKAIKSYLQAEKLAEKLAHDLNNKDSKRKIKL